MLAAIIKECMVGGAHGCAVVEETSVPWWESHPIQILGIICLIVLAGVWYLTRHTANDE